MLFYSENDIKGDLKKKINDLLGDQIPVSVQLNTGGAGSVLYRLKKLSVDNKYADLTDLNSRCNLEKFSKGFLLRINHRQELRFIAISFGEIDKLELIRGKENISPLFFGPMRFLLKAGVHIRYARYFRIALSEYSVEPMILKIVSGNQRIELDSNGYNYYSQANYFKTFLEG